MKKSYTPNTKLKVALCAIKNDKTITEICQEYSVANSQVYKWKKQLLESGASIFEHTAKKPSESAEIEKLYKQIGKLTVELDFAKKCAGL